MMGENTKLTKRFLLGFFMAPLVAPIVFTVIILLFSGYMGIGGDSNCSFSNVWSCVDGFIVVFFIGVPIAYLVVFLFGLPLYYLFYRMKWINFLSISLGAGGASIMPLLISYIPTVLNNGIENIGIKDFYTFLLIFTCGVFVGIVFWIITRGFKSETEVN